MPVVNILILYINILNYSANDGSYKKKNLSSENRGNQGSWNKGVLPPLPKLVVYVLLMFSSPLNSSSCGEDLECIIYFCIINSWQ